MSVSGVLTNGAARRITWNDFLEQLAEGLEILQRRVPDAPAAPTSSQAPPSPVVPDYGSGSHARNDVLIGIGRWDAIGHGADAPICLNNKGAGERCGGRRFASVTRLVLDAWDALGPDWMVTLGEDAAPARFFGRFTLRVEDASPDSVFGLVCFLALANGVPAEAVPAAWVSSITRWEVGEVRFGVDPSRSYCALHSALVHGRLDTQWDRAWLDALRMVHRLLRDGVDPNGVPDTLSTTELDHARALLSFERRRYQDGLALAHHLHLLLPLTDAPGRFRNVDALLEEERLASGTQKVFVRTDRDHADLGDGFVLWGLYRPTLAGTGYDMTVSLSVEAGLTLEPLWTALEDLENDRWGADRPRSRPRQDIVAYPAGRDRETDGADRNAPNEPWYDGGNYSLVAAPRRIAKGDAQAGDLGSRLGWTEVCEAIWTAFSPLRFARFTCGEATSLTLDACVHRPDQQLSDEQHRVFLLKWEKPPLEDSRDGTPTHTTTLLRAFAALLTADAGAQRISLADLPPLGAFDEIAMPGGFAIVSADGAVVVDDITAVDLEPGPLRDDLHRAHRLVTDLKQREADLTDLAQAVRAHIAGVGKRRRTDKSMPRRKLRATAVLDRLTRLRLDLRTLITETLPASTDPSHLAFRDALHLRWNLKDRVDALYKAADELETLLLVHSELRTNRMIGFLTIYGFPFLFFAAFFQFVIADLVDFGLSPAGIHVPGLIGYLVISVIAMLLLTVWLRRR